jgi:aspartyl/glutamyl-tRNA(Asn/Gln) amidotransferase C subunit
MSVLVNAEDIKKVANLGRIYKTASDDQNHKLQTDLHSVLSMIQKLSSLELSKYSPQAAFKVIRIDELRLDEPNNESEEYKRVRQNIINNFPSRQGDLLQLPIRIIEEN